MRGLCEDSLKFIKIRVYSHGNSVTVRTQQTVKTIVGNHVCFKHIRIKHWHMKKKPVVVSDEPTVKWVDLGDIPRLEETDLYGVQQAVTLSREGIDESVHVIKGMLNPGFETGHHPLNCILCKYPFRKFEKIHSAAQNMVTHIEQYGIICCTLDFKKYVVKYAQEEANNPGVKNYPLVYVCRKHMYIMSSMVEITVLCKIEFMPHQYDNAFPEDADTIFGIIYRLAHTQIIH